MIEEETALRIKFCQPPRVTEAACRAERPRVHAYVPPVHRRPRYSGIRWVRVRGVQPASLSEQAYRDGVEKNGVRGPVETAQCVGGTNTPPRRRPAAAVALCCAEIRREDNQLGTLRVDPNVQLSPRAFQYVASSSSRSGAESARKFLRENPMAGAQN